MVIKQVIFSLKVGKVIALIALTAVLQACSYSITVINQNGKPKPDPMNHELGFYNGLQVTTVDTVVRLKVLQNRVTYVDSTCEKGAAGFYSVEYKITFGDMLRNTFTAGKRKAVRVKLVCIKPSNQ